jgi:branched-chain amino acid transport system substrate-binding protein
VPTLSRTVFVLLAACGLAGCSPRTPAGPIVIGHLAPLSGPKRAIGEQARNGILLAVEEINQEDQRIAGQTIEVHHADARAGDSAAADEAARLITVNRAVALLGSCDAALAEAIARTAQSQGILFITSSPLPDPLPGDSVYSTAVSPRRQGEVLARVAREQLGARRVVLLVDQRSASVAAAAAAFERALTRAAHPPLERGTYDSETSLAELASRVMKAKPDAVLLAGAAADLRALRPHLPGGDAAMAILFIGEGGAREVQTMSTEIARGIHVATTFVADDSAPRAKAFAMKYQERFGDAADDSAAAAYEGIWLLVEVLRQANARRAERARDVVPDLEPIETLTGPLTLDPETHHARRPVFVVTREGGAVQVVQRYRAE